MIIKRHELVSLGIGVTLVVGLWVWWAYDAERLTVEAEPAEPAWILGAQGEIYVIEADSVVSDDGEAAWGEADYARRQIRIERGLPEGFRGMTVRHERCHFALSDADLYIREWVPDSAAAVALEDRICNAIAEGFR